MLPVVLLIALGEQVSGLVRPPICTQALTASFGAAASEICLAEEEEQRAVVEKDSSEQRSRFETAARHPHWSKRAANIPRMSNHTRPWHNFTPDVCRP
jgi:hypothetical protein